MSRTGGGQHRPTPSPSEAPAQIQTTRFRFSDLPYTIISSHSRRSANHHHIISLTHSLARVSPGVLYMVLHTSRPDDSSPSTTDRPTSLETELISEGVGRRTEAFSLRRRPSVTHEPTYSAPLFSSLLPESSPNCRPVGGVISPPSYAP